MIRPSWPHVRARRRARARSSIGVSAGVSSMYSWRLVHLLDRLGQPRPVVVLQPAGAQALLVDAPDRARACAAPAATRPFPSRTPPPACPWSTATCSAMFSASAVLPIDGRAGDDDQVARLQARRSCGRDRRSRWARRSRRTGWRARTAPGCARPRCVSSGLNLDEALRPRAPSSAIWKILASASSRICLTSLALRD